MDSNKAVIIFIKNPELGKVKTRLAKTVGDDRALKIYKSLMSHTRKMVEPLAAEKLLFYSEWINENDEWSSQIFRKHLQPSGTLGNRMTVAFDVGFQNKGPVIIVGSDCPGLSNAIIEEAFTALEKSDFVIGPALDGGYYLLGMKSFSPSLFQDIEFSTDTVKEETIGKIKQLGKSYHELIALSDIDYEADWIKYGWEV